MKVRFSTTGYLVLLIMLAGLTVSCSSTPSVRSEVRTIPIGVLLPLTGDLAASGESELTALRHANEDLQPFLDEEGAPFRLELAVEDTQTDPETALEAIQKLTDDGARIVIGPDSSEAVFRVLPWANWFNVVVISPASTAPTLAIEDDNLFRMTPDDSHQAKAIAHKMWVDGKRIIVPVYRDDQYANDLVTAVKVNITMLGGTMLKGIRYGADAKNFRRIASRLRKEVQHASQEYGTAALAVYVVGFEEANVLCRAARKHSALQAVNWYGNESLAVNDDLVNDRDVGPFLADRQFTCPQYVAKDSETSPVRTRLEEELGRPVETYTLAAYDALWLVAHTIMRAGVDAEVTELKTALLEAAESYNGVTGSTEMNSAGDRKRGDYDFWQVQVVDGQPEWVNIYSFSE